jgi:hypothetical protein
MAIAPTDNTGLDGLERKRACFEVRDDPTSATNLCFDVAMAGKCAVSIDLPHFAQHALDRCA